MLALLARLRRFGLAVGVAAAASAAFLLTIPRNDLRALPRWLSAGIVIVLGLSVFLLFCLPFVYSNYKQLGSVRGQLRDAISARSRRHS